MTGESSVVNKAHWDTLASLHGDGSDGYYDLDSLLAGHTLMIDAEWEAIDAAVGELLGLDVLHVQCHIGFDSVSLARAGAKVTGVDFSATALEKAATIAAKCGVSVDFVEADSTDLPESLHARFDLAYASMGILGWIEDLDAWMASVAACLRPTGRLVLIELHPLFTMLKAGDPLEAHAPYAFDGARVVEEEGSYADLADEITTTSVQYSHGVGEIVTAAAGAGLVVDQVREHLETEFDPLGSVLTRDADGRWRYRLDGYPLPVLLSLQATRP